MFMKKMMKVLWKKGFLSFVLAVSFLAGAIAPGGYARAAAPAAIPATLSLKEATGVCSGSATAFNVNSTSFESSKLKFYREMLDGVHQQNRMRRRQRQRRIGFLLHICFIKNEENSRQPVITTLEWKQCGMLQLQNTIIPIRYPIMSIKMVITGTFIAVV